MFISAKKIFLGLSIMLSVQILTYFTISPNSLKAKILPHYFASLHHNSDSLLVKGYYASECYVGENYIFFSHNLEKDKDILAKKLNVEYVVFIDYNTSTSELVEKNYNLVYSTWYKRGNWRSLFSFFGAKQFESLVIDNKSSYRREGTYHWFLLFWIQTFESFHSGELDQ